MDEKLYVFEFSITNHCQAKCPTCNRTNEESGEPHPWLVLEHFDIEEFKKIVESEWWINRKIAIVKLCGEMGDPCMHPKIEEFVELAFASGAKEVFINTNGGLRQPKWYTHMGERFGKKLSIVFGIDGLDHETNNKYRKGVNTQRAMDNMAAFHAAGGRSLWQFIIFDFNAHQLKDYAKLCDQLGYEKHPIWNTGKYGLIHPIKKRYIESNWERLIGE